MKVQLYTFSIFSKIVLNSTNESTDRYMQRWHSLILLFATCQHNTWHSDQHKMQLRLRPFNQLHPGIEF